MREVVLSDTKFVEGEFAESEDRRAGEAEGAGAVDVEKQQTEGRSMSW